MLQDHTFSMRFRMGYDDFMALADLLRPALKRDEEMGLQHNGTIPVEYQVAMTLGWLAGGVHLWVHGRPCHREEYGVLLDV